VTDAVTPAKAGVQTNAESFLDGVLGPGPFDAACGVAQDMLRRDDVGGVRE
jgi:hypothetical protein